MFSITIIIKFYIFNVEIRSVSIYLKKIGPPPNKNFFSSCNHAHYTIKLRYFSSFFIENRQITLIDRKNINYALINKK